MTRHSGRTFLIERYASIPLMPGIITSVRNKSKGSETARSTAPNPLYAMAVRKPLRLRTFASVSAMTGSSSATSILSLSDPGLGIAKIVPDFVGGGKARLVGRLRCGRVNRHNFPGLPLQVGDALEEDSFQIHECWIVRREFLVFLKILWRPPECLNKRELRSQQIHQNIGMRIVGYLFHSNVGATDVLKLGARLSQFTQDEHEESDRRGKTDGDQWRLLYRGYPWQFWLRFT